YLVHGIYDNHEKSFIENVLHLPPGHLISFQLAKHIETSPIRWWQPNFNNISTLSFVDAAAEIREKFLVNVKLHLRSDVPIGVALSGGIDSSAIVCAMRYLEPKMPIHTFTYIAENCDFNEESWANKVNKHVGAIPHQVFLSKDSLLSDLEDMIIAQGEPFGSTSIYAQYCVFKHAKEAGITVMLEGQGADELLAGYDGYPGFRLLSLLENREYVPFIKFLNNWAKWPNRSHKLAIMELARILFPDQIYATARKYLGRDFRPNWLNIDMLKGHGIAFTEN
ncbi:asparagine synthase, partial [Achromatium sp. WMS1]